MGFLDSILDNTVGRIPYAGDTLGSIGKGVGNVVEAPLNIGASILNNAMQTFSVMSKNLMQVGQNLSNFVATPYFTYAMIGLGVYIVYKIASDPVKSGSTAMQFIPQGRLGKMASNYI